MEGNTRKDTFTEDGCSLRKSQMNAKGVTLIGRVCGSRGGTCKEEEGLETRGDDALGLLLLL